MAAAISFQAAVFLPSAAGAADLDILGFRLGMGMEEGQIDSIYETQLKPQIAESGLMNLPYTVIHTRLKDGTLLYLHFAPPVEGKKLFGVVHIKRYGSDKQPSTLALETVLKAMERQLGKPGVSLEPDPAMRVLIYSMAGTPPVDPNLTPDSVRNITFMDFPGRVRLLGADFKGAIVLITVDKGKVQSIRQELWDHRLATSVFAVPEAPAAAR